MLHLYGKTSRWSHVSPLFKALLPFLHTGIDMNACHFMFSVTLKLVLLKFSFAYHLFSSNLIEMARIAPAMSSLSCLAVHARAGELSLGRGSSRAAGIPSLSQTLFTDAGTVTVASTGTIHPNRRQCNEQLKWKWTCGGSLHDTCTRTVACLLRHVCHLHLCAVCLVWWGACRTSFSALRWGAFWAAAIGRNTANPIESSTRSVGNTSSCIPFLVLSQFPHKLSNQI